MKSYFKIIFVIGIVIFFGCNETSRHEIKDVIPVVKLFSGQTDSVLVSDLFYSENYDLKFSDNSDIEIKYLQDSRILILRANNNYEGMTLVNFDFHGENYSIPVTVELQQTHTFTFSPKKEYNSITLFGNFNQWNRQNLPMTDEDGDGTYEITLPFEAGKYEYKFFADGEEFLDPLNPAKIPNGIGGENSVFTIKPRHTENIYLHQLKYAEDYNEYVFEYLNKDREVFLNDHNIIALVNNQQVKPIDLSVEERIIKVKMEDTEGENLLRIAVTEDGQNSNIQYIYTYNGKPINDNHWTWQDGVIYSLMIDRFYDGDPSINKPIVNDSLSEKANYMGGDLQGVINKLNEGYFDSLGVNIIWISPVNDNPNEAFREYPAPHRYFSGYHGYWPIHHLRVEEKFGTMNKLKELVKTAHGKNIKVLLDFVSNHVHKEHPFFKNHRDWFGNLELPNGKLNLRLWDSHRLTTWFEPYLPSFDYLGSQEAIDVMTDNAVWWLKSTGADGFRHDAVKHVPNKFWRELTRKIKKEISIPQNKYVYQIGETFGDYDLVSSYVNNGQLSSQFNFELYNSAQTAFIDTNQSFELLNNELNKTSEVYGTINYMGNIMDSHDKNRYMAYTDGDLKLSQWSAVEEGWNNPPKVENPESYKKMELYMAYMNSIPGLPVIYYGSEFGMTGASDPDNRRMMRFDKQLDKYEKETLKDVRQIINTRDKYPALRYGDYYNLEADKNIFAYIRSYMNQRILVVINKSNKPQNITLDIPSIYGIKSIANLETDEKIGVENSKLRMEVNGISWRMYLMEF